MDSKNSSYDWLDGLDFREIVKESKHLQAYLLDEHEAALPYEEQQPFITLVAKREALDALAYDYDKYMSGEKLYAVAPEPPELNVQSAERFLDRVKREFRCFLCTNDDRYRGVRDKLRVSAGQVEKIVLNTISAALAAYLGVAAGALVGICAIILFIVGKIGKEAYCAVVG